MKQHRTEELVKLKPVIFAYSESVFRTPFTATTDEGMEKEAKQQFQKAERLIIEMQADDESPEDGWIVHNDVLYRVCRSSKKSYRTIGDEAKKIKKALIKRVEEAG